MELTVGMATYQDFDGVYFTVQSLRMYQDMDDVEILVVDNFGCEATRSLIEEWVNGRYLRSTNTTGTAAPRDLVFREARGESVLCIDSHVMLAPGALSKLKQYYREHPDSLDLLQGPLLHDDLTTLASHFDPIWQDQMWGVWAQDERACNEDGEPFDIPMQGLGLFSCRRRAWPGFNPSFRGFGGEEGYLHEKFRQLGRRCLCLPWLRWVHRFHRSGGVKYPLLVEDKLHNYLVGHRELGLDVEPVIRHFEQFLPRQRLEGIIKASLGRPESSEQAEAIPVESNLGKWDNWFRNARSPRAFGRGATYKKAASFLGDLPLIEDWGCGLAWFRQFVRPEQYRGVDGSCSPFADLIVDLCEYTSNVDGILIRHVLEHNDDWETVLLNALKSFRQKMCLIVFTPFAATTTRTAVQELSPGKRVPSYSFSKQDLTRHFDGISSWREERVGSETVFYLEK